MSKQFIQFQVIQKPQNGGSVPSLLIYGLDSSGVLWVQDSSDSNKEWKQVK